MSSLGNPITKGLVAFINFKVENTFMDVMLTALIVLADSTDLGAQQLIII